MFSFREAKQLSRHGMELEKSIKPTSHQTQLLRNLVTTTTPEDGIHPDDPINHLKVLERELLDKVETVQHSKGKIGWSAKNEPNKDHVDEFHNSEKKLGLDVKTSQSEETLSQLTENDAPQSCSNVEKLLTREDPVVRAFVVPIPTEEVERNRMSSDEIRSTQKFASHSHGEPSNVRYI